MWINLFIYLFIFVWREDIIFIALLTITYWYKVLKTKACKFSTGSFAASFVQYDMQLSPSSYLM